MITRFREFVAFAKMLLDEKRRNEDRKQRDLDRSTLHPGCSRNTYPDDSTPEPGP